ncbi:MAG: dephospho-CoA kinase [Thermus sp.]|uniref:dephospho-CoA kinase n=1 Tax=unclassified Thermus TaxID=2619321 RepID=UPI00023898E1|nr:MULTISPECIES: dephospho-CoA kinase [unclassified Thermus]AEV16464.1 Dephospho-CoA kinase [Thermus sp. CCB_US3_UF1]MCS6869001.1 dephospho-CoA kinase [Thermus sp.]MCS7219504.1 dephospho-CoA kinase [Thermus sp.]MDW8018037.1 dephospho-CoA kinase [Thermus sp.]MDW8356905.1 dephospho-CoA kinase [Thermus sp.]
MGDEAKHPIIIGITGNIGSGKSTVARFLRAWGYPVLDLDGLAERARERRKEELKRLFPGAFRGEELDRRALAQEVFADPKRLQALEAVLHPEIRRLLEEEVARLEAPLLFLEIPLLFEKGWEGRLAGTLLVAAPLEVRLERAMARSGLSREEVLARERAQMPEEEKRKRATWVLENTGSLEDLEAGLREILSDIRARFGVR